MAGTRCDICEAAPPLRMLGHVAVCARCLDPLEKLAERVALYTPLTQRQALERLAVRLNGIVGIMHEEADHEASTE